MYNNDEVINYLQANKILALKLDHAVSAVGQQVTNQVETLGKGASAHRLHVQYPAYYSALYMQQLEMMYFLIEPVFERAGALEAQWSSDSGIANIITRMIR